MSRRSRHPSKYERLRIELYQAWEENDDMRREIWTEAKEHYELRTAALQAMNEQLLKRITDIAALQAPQLFILPAPPKP